MTDPGQSTRSVPQEEAPQFLWRRPTVWAGVIAIVISVAMNVPVLRRALEELGIELGAFSVLAIGAWMASRIGDSSQASWGSRGVWAGVVAIVVSLVMGSPFIGGGAFGELRLVLSTLGLLCIAAGLTALLGHRAWSTTARAVAVGVTVAAIGAFVFVGADQVPVWPESCATAPALTLENPGPLYCHEGDGTLVRISIGNVRQCPDGSVIWDISKARRWGSGWETHGPGTGCPL